MAETDGKKAALEQLRSQVAAAKKQLKSEKAELKHLRKLDDVQAECTQAKASISKVEDNLQSRVASTTEATRRIAELESQTTGWKSEIKALSKEVTQLVSIFSDAAPLTSYIWDPTPYTIPNYHSIYLPCCDHLLLSWCRRTLSERRRMVERK